MKRRIVLGFALAGVLLATLVGFVGGEDVAERLSAADYRIVALGLVSGLLAITFRGLVWFRFLSVIDRSIPRRYVGSIFLTALFLKYVTPYGQIATGPFVAYLLARDAEMTAEDGLAGVLSADLLNYVPYYTFGFLGLASLFTAGTLGDELTGYLAAFVGLFVAVLVASTVVVRRPDLVSTAVLAGAALGRRTVGRFVARVREALSPDAVRERVEGFYATVDRLAADRRTLVAAAVYAHLGMAFLMAPVYIGAAALGYEVALPVVALVVALGKLGSVVPAPGGLGGVEAVVTVGLTALAGFDPPAALTVALIYRVCTYGLTLVVGGLAAIGLTFRA